MKQATKKDYRQRGLKAIDKLAKQSGLNQIAFPEWLPIITPNWTWTWKHQIYLYQKLQEVTDGTCKRLMIFMPPRHSKSETVTVRYSAFRLERKPEMNIILGSYSQDLANRFSRKIKRITRQRIKLSSDRNAVAEWETAIGGGLRAAGVGAGVTGFGADLIMVDDPIKNRKEAESETYRNNVEEWFNDDLYTRLEPNGAIILTLTRWHHDDLAGRLIKQMQEGGEHWDIVCLPAIAEENDPLGRKLDEALCPERYDTEALNLRKKKLGSYSFSALYQQRPTPREGAVFKLDWFKNKIIDSAPPNLRWVRGYDLAVETKSQNDHTASFKIAFDDNGNMYIDGGFRAKIEAPQQKKYILERFHAERNTVHAITKAIHGSSFVQELRRLPAARGVAFKAVTEKGDKYTRALAWATRAEEGRVYLIRGGWNDEFLNELMQFTGSGKDKEDDQVDAVSIGVQQSSKRSGKLIAHE
jgi:predicted phage terminase large subunit-like protein